MRQQSATTFPGVGQGFGQLEADAIPKALLKAENTKIRPESKD